MYLPTILGASLLLVGSSFGADTDSIPGYTIVPQSWEIEVSPGVIKTFNGTVQEMVAQAVAINPAFKLPAISSRAVTSPSKNSRSMPLARREVKFCNNFGPAKVDAILEGVQYLHRLGGIPTLPPGPGTCSRISCSYDSAIFWCNDNRSSKTVSWEFIANSAGHITQICNWQGEGNNQYISGQNFEQGLWNTLIRRDPC